MGIVVPMVKTVEEAQAIVSASRYPPQGTRSFGPLRASNYTLDYEEYLNQANENTLIGVIIETKEAVDDMESIAAVPGIDVLFMGMFDMCLSLGLNPFEMPFPVTDAVIERALAIGRKGDAAIGTGEGNPEAFLERAAQGFTFLAYGPDYGLLVRGARAGLDAFNQL